VLLPVYQLESNASSSFSDMGIETQINPDSSIKKIKKLQNFLYDLEVYNGSINGDYNEIEDILINYQLEKGIIEDKDEW
jgi:hypothetical protein